MASSPGVLTLHCGSGSSNDEPMHRFNFSADLGVTRIVEPASGVG